jgi:cobalt/nickel transport protein
MPVLQRVLAAAIAVTIGGPASAHFVSIYTPDAYLAEAATVPVGLLFWHPLGDGPAIDMARPQEFFLINRGRQTDLLPLLAPKAFATAAGPANGFTAMVPLRSTGDYIFTVVPEPHRDPIGGFYIQAITKAYVNRGQLPSDWYRPVGLKAEIVPMTRPYGVFVASTFTGLVLSGGEPVPGAKVEVVYMAAPLNLADASAGAPTVKPPRAGIVTVLADANGFFTFGIPRAGWWCFSAIGVGPDVRYEDRPLSQDAAIWIYASEFGQ